MIGNGQTYIEDNQSWQCNRAAAIKGVLGENSGILVATGGESWMAESVQPGFLACDALDVISIHAYGTGDFATSSIETYVKQAQKPGKKLIFEEWCVHFVAFAHTEAYIIYGFAGARVILTPRITTVRKAPRFHRRKGAAT